MKLRHKIALKNGKIALKIAKNAKNCKNFTNKTEKLH